MDIHEWLRELETDRTLSKEDYYRKLLEARDQIQGNLDCAESDGVDLEELDYE